MTVFSLNAAQCRQQRAFEPIAFGMRQAPMNTTLQFTVEIFVRIELRGVGREVEELDLVAVTGHPRTDLARVVHPQIVHNQKHLALGVLDQPLHEPDQQIGIHATVVDHESHHALVADRRDDLGAHAPRRHAGHRSLAGRRKAPAEGTVTAKTGLITPVNHRPLGLRAGLDLRIGLLQPLANRCRVLFQRLLERALWRQAPARQIPADTRQRQLDAALTLDQWYQFWWLPAIFAAVVMIYFMFTFNDKEAEQQVLKEDIKI
jgi:hypothetical protein